MNYLLLVFASVALVGVVAAQNWIVPTLRNETISTGLTGPAHWWLDGSYVLLAVTLVWAAVGKPWSLAFAVISGSALILTAATNTLAGFFDRLTGGQHALWHSRFTTVVFVAALALQLSANHGPALWSLTLANIVVPAAMYGLSKRSDYTEKVGVLLICVWLIAWALTML